jgi:hypothetical protein
MVRNEVSWGLVQGAKALIRGVDEMLEGLLTYKEAKQPFGHHIDGFALWRTPDGTQNNPYLAVTNS